MDFPGSLGGSPLGTVLGLTTADLNPITEKMICLDV